MGIDIEWYNAEKTLMVQRYSGNWNSHDIYDTAEKAYEMIASVSHKVDIIIIYINSSQSISNMVASASLAFRRYIDEHTHENTGMIVVIGASRLLKTALKVKMLRPKSMDNAHFVDTFQEAVSYITSQRIKSEPS